MHVHIYREREGILPTQHCITLRRSCPLTCLVRILVHYRLMSWLVVGVGPFPPVPQEWIFAQVINGNGRRVDAAWKRFEAFAGSEASGATPGQLIYHQGEKQERVVGSG